MGRSTFPFSMCEYPSSDKAPIDSCIGSDNSRYILADSNRRAGHSLILSQCKISNSVWIVSVHDWAETLAMGIWMRLLSSLICLAQLCTSVPTCENSMHPLPTLSSCLLVIGKIIKDAQKHPFLYEWSRHPDSSVVDEMKLPRTWIDTEGPFTYHCAVTVDLIRGREKKKDSFSFKDIVIVAQRIVNACLITDRGIRPQVGWDLVGFFEEPKVVRVALYSVRSSGLKKMNYTSITETAREWDDAESS